MSVVIGDTHVSFSLDAAGSDKLTERERMGYAFQARDARHKMRLSLNHWRSPQEKALSWQDLDGDRIENHLREIVMELIVRGEQSYRDSLIRHRERRIERQAQLQEQERKRKAEKERIAKERLAKLERLRVDHLLKQADAMRQAVQIRSYVAAIQETNKTAPQPMSDEELNSWTQWALAQADRIDPVISGAYKTRPPEPEE